MTSTNSLVQAVEWHQQGHIAQARQIYESVLVTDPNHFDARHLLGVTYLQTNDLELARTHIQAALNIHPASAAAHSNLGRVWHESKAYEKAVASYDQAIALKPDFAEAHYNKGNALRELKQMEAANACYQAAIALKPNYAEAYQNLGVIAQEQRHLAQAVAYYDQAIALQPTHAQARSNRGVALKAMHRIEEALKSFDLAISVNPNYAQAYWNKAITLLLDGQYDKGWQLYEWGWAAKQRGTPRHTHLPLWKGLHAIQGKTILLHAEQGYGDTLQFCRFAHTLSDMGATVWLEVPSALIDLMRGLKGVQRLIPMGQAITEPVDFQCPLLSLPLALKTTLQSIPTATAYLHAEPSRSALWASKLAGFQNKKVGLVWNGGFRAHQPELWLVNSERNVALTQLAQHLQHSNIDFFSLQKGDPAESELRGHETAHWPQGNMHNFTQELHTFADTAALIDQLDLVISVDTSTAHLAAAMGKPVWLLNRYDSCWRWLRDIDHSPWYPSVRIYRQNEDRQWHAPLQQLAKDLTQFAND